ncbi:DUF202 domain-containing protein [Rhodococcus sp. WB9]|uniref:YidH family protein n=1 Tax=Rhodococcus sp. WB9 TaxID=2594007 RepID=UPI001185D52A|nr:DUF202 domain-containing protein [Rhodococcus sp. WB9]QDQ94282.1 DUF202 domain-containing protein [Rhodococcus sp. WB9]
MIRRFPSAVYRKGTEPDARFSLANERTFLAWIRTSLAFVAAGVAIEALNDGDHRAFRFAAAIVLVSTGIVATVQAWVGWFSTEQSLREGRPLPSTRVALPMGVAALISGLLVALAMLLP